MDNINKQIGLQTPLETAPETLDNIDEGKGRIKQELVEKMYNFFPELGPLLKKALEGSDVKEAQESLQKINDLYFTARKGSYTSVDWENPANGRKLTLNIYGSVGKFQKDSASLYSVEVKWQLADFEH